MRGFLFALVLLLVASCSGSTGPGPDTRNSVYPDHTIAATGQPWEDYHPGRILVVYHDLMDAAALPPAPALPPDKCAANRPNALLRDRPEYEAITDAIAGRYGLEIATQVYTGRTNIASFILPDDSGDSSVLGMIRSEFSDFIDAADFSPSGHLCYMPNDPTIAASNATSGPAWQIHRMNVPAAWEYTMGSPEIMVATLDTGVRLTHEELVGRVINPEVDYPEITANTYHHVKQITDDYGHGTDVASLVSAATDNGRTVVGVAPCCRHLPIKVFDGTGNTTLSAVIEGCYLARDLGADIVSMSFTTVDYGEVWHNAIKDLSDRGILVVAGAGNGNRDYCSLPARYPEVLAVGGTLYDDERISILWGSDYGEEVDIAAPGEYLKTCYKDADSGTDAYRDFGGTSASTPLVAACAALVWSAFPELTAEQVRETLINTSAPVTGFTSDIGRPDMASVFASLSCGTISPSLLDQAVFSTTIALSLDVTGNLESIRAEQASNRFLQTLTAAPWDFAFNLGAISFGTESITFRSQSTDGGWDMHVSFPVDNTAGSFPLHEDFNSFYPGVAVADGRFFTAELFQSFNLCGFEHASPRLARTASKGTWHRIPGGGPDGSNCWYFGLQETGGYDAHEMDLLILPRVDLTGVDDGLLRFKHRYNIPEYLIDTSIDVAAVMVLPESTGIWEVPSNLGLEPIYLGMSNYWSEEFITLAGYAGQTISIGFMFNSDDSGSNPYDGDPAGWWIDDISITSGGPLMEDADFDDPAIAAYCAFGSVPGDAIIDLEITGNESLSETTFVLDFAPCGEIDSRDLITSSKANPAAAEFTVSPDLPNQYVELIILSRNVLHQPGRISIIPLFIYNKFGDANGDGFVDDKDRDLIGAGLGLSIGEPGYVPYADTDGDGVITESDISAIGYFWETSQPGQ